ncbi:MAG: GNAT family N-acetyltransferase [Fimbriimonas sp.]
MIRAATHADLPRVLELIYKLAEYERLAHCAVGTVDMLKEDLDRGAFWCLVAEDDNAEVVGFALGARTYSTFRARPSVWLEDLFVEPSHRGTGLGKSLLLAVVEMARQEGAGRVDWAVLDWNEPSIRFYEAMGATVMSDWRICRIEL